MQCALKERNNTESDMYAKILAELTIIKIINVIREAQKRISLITAGTLLKKVKRPIRVLLNLERYNLLRLYQLFTFNETVTCSIIPTVKNSQKTIPQAKLTADFSPLELIPTKNIANKDAEKQLRR